MSDARRAAEAMRESAAQHFERNRSYFINVSRDEVAARIRALPLPEATSAATPDPRDVGLAAEDEATSDPRDEELKQARPWVLFYRDGKNLGEITAELGGTIYDYSPWLAAPMVRGLMNELDKIEQRNATIARLSAELEAAKDALVSPTTANVRVVAKAISAVWNSENKTADIEQATTLFEPSARAAIAALAKLAAKGA